MGAKTLELNTGIQKYTVNGVPFQFSASDYNLSANYGRLIDALEEIGAEYNAVMDALGENADGVQDDPGKRAKFNEASLKLAQIDVRLKKQLQETFGVSNDFNAMFDGVHCLSLTDTGFSVIENFLMAIEPEITNVLSARGELVRKRVDTARANANANRAARRSKK